MTVKIKAAIMGGTGYAAEPLTKRLLTHPNVEITKMGVIGSNSFSFFETYIHLIRSIS